MVGIWSSFGGASWAASGTAASGTAAPDAAAPDPAPAAAAPGAAAADAVPDAAVPDAAVPDAAVPDAAQDAPPNDDQMPTIATPTDNPNPKPLPISEGDYLAAWYGPKVYIGQVLAVDKKDGELNFNFMEQCSTRPPTYKWPDIKDDV